MKSGYFLAEFVLQAFGVGSAMMIFLAGIECAIVVIVFEHDETRLQSTGPLRTKTAPSIDLHIETD